VIELRSLTKRYGKTVAVADLSCTIEPGQVTGFLGPNGAGKSTTMRMILGLDRPTTGSALVRGRLYEQLKARCGRSARCWTRAPCTRAGPHGNTCAVWPTATACRSGGSTKCRRSSG
jgi:ABC-type branched-subunit amino acid transport system ATPase component